MAQPTQRNYAHKGHHKQYAPLTHSKPQKRMVATAMLTQSKPVSNIAVRPVSAALPNITVTRPRHAHHVVTKFKSPIRRHITRSPSSKTSNSPPRVTAAEAPMVIKFGDSYEVPESTTTTNTTSGKTDTKSGRTVTLTAKDMQKKKNDVKARTTLLLSLPDEHQLRFSKSDLETMSLDDLYNHLKVYESEVQKKSEPNSQNMAFISSAKHSSGSEDEEDREKDKHSGIKRGEKIETLKQEKEGVDGKLAGLLTASKNLDNLIESQRSDKNKDGLGYSAVPPPLA
nr:hypothetical protein [Tanacetum cinerariifolium]